MIRPHKGRMVDLTRPVQVYKNLHNGLFSIRQDGLVRGHTQELQLTHVTFKVSQAGRERVIKERKKNVHAFVCGIIRAEKVNDSTASAAITYNPYKYDTFVFKDTQKVANLPTTAVLNCHSTKGLWVGR